MIASLTTLCGLYDLALLGVPHLPGINQGLKEYIIQGKWLSAIIGISLIINGISTFRGKTRPWKEIVLLQLVAIVFWTISLIVFFSNPSSVNGDAQVVVVVTAPLPVILIQIVISMLVLLCFFTPKVRLYSGKRNFSIRRLVVIADLKGV